MFLCFSMILCMFLVFFGNFLYVFCLFNEDMSQNMEN